MDKKIKQEEEMKHGEKILGLLKKTYPIDWDKKIIETDDPFNEHREIHISKCGEFTIKKYDNWDDEETSFVLVLDYFKYHPEDEYYDVLEFETLEKAMEWCSLLKYKYEKMIRSIKQ